MLRVTLLLALACLGFGGAGRADPTQASVTIRFSSHQSCLVGNSDVACAEVGSLLRDMHLSKSADIHLMGDETTRSALVTVAMNSLKKAGYSTKVAVLTGSE